MCDTKKIMVHWICWISSSFSSFHQFLNNYTSQVIQSWPLFIVIIIWTVKPIYYIFWEVIKKYKKNLLICRLFYTYFTFTYTHQWSFLSEYWYLPHSEVQFYSSMKFSQWLDIYLTVTWYWCHGDLIFMSRWLLIFTSQWLLIFTSQWLDIYFTVT